MAKKKIVKDDALELLKNYNGDNNYLINIRYLYLNNPNFSLTDNQIEYISLFSETKPKIAKKWVELDPYYATMIADDKLLLNIPDKMWVEKLLAEKEKSYHVFGKFFDNDKLNLYWIPKDAIVVDKTNKNVVVDFEKYSHRMPFEHQKTAIIKLLENDKFILADDMGLGKFLKNDTLIYTDLGVKKMGEIVVGDKVIGSNGKPCNVIGVFPQGKKETYKITFNDGYSIIAGDEHLWSVSSANYSKNRKNNRIKKSLILSTKQMYEGGKIKIKGNGYNNQMEYEVETFYKTPNGNNKWQIPIVKPIEFYNNVELPINPYLLGLGLGDGSFKGKNIKFSLHKDDYDELFDNFNLKENKPADNKRNGYINVDNSLFDLCLEHTRSHTKFIPDIYKYSSIENRLAILQGLMDTDGHCVISKNKVFQGTEYSTVSERLCDDVAEIVHTLGGICRKSSKRGAYTKNGVRVECKISYKLNIKLSNDMNPFRLKRKADAYNQPKKYSVGRYIKNIEKVGEDECTCISVDADDKLYVAEHCIVTHNTSSAIVASIEAKPSKTLVICPASLKQNWKREIENYTDKSIYICDGKKYDDNADFIIINYDIIKNFHSLKLKEETVIQKSKFDLVIIDESHYIKNPQASRTKLINDICKDINKIWLLTGTPLTSRPIDYFNLLSLVGSNVSKNWMAYVLRYCAGYQFTVGMNKVWNVNGASNLDELRERTSPLLLRRLKENVLDLPEKIITPVYLTLKSKEYEEVMGEYFDWVKNNPKESKSLSVQFTKLMKVRQIIADEKIKNTIELIENTLEQGRKVIAFSNFTNSLNKIYEHFKKVAVKLDGSSSMTQRQDSVDKFQNDENVKVFVGNIKAAGVGVTLTSGDVVIFNDLSFVPADHSQAEDRAYRIGQKNSVSVLYPIFENTIEGIIYDMLDRKKKIISTVLGDNLIEGDVSEDILTQILNFGK
ncbi:MAG: DEAD/DEAH box helicase family protein [Chitinophagaceae bacterium]|nr:DEAD/DEAH box helicase family protein [Chitinophagaceae bacterium]